ncbi:MAG TPA: hypothetical protein VHV75_13080 [Solirubrobacteraceae bacterium]|nr:hypothetical protein [Solirubrobacteraceae bacterium]
MAKFTISAIWFVYRLVATLLLAGGALGQIILIITRNLFGAQPASSTVAATLALTMGGVLYIGVCPSHISFRVANDGLRRLIPGFGALCALIAAAISGALAYYGVRAVIDQHALGASVQSFNFPVWVAFLVLPLSATALCVRFVTQAWRELDPLKKEKHS